MIGVEIAGGAAIVDKLRGFPDRMTARRGGVMQSLGLALQERVQTELGGGVLHRRSGRLEAGVEMDIASNEGHVAASLGIGNVPYAAYQEYGFHGTETVRAHLRTVKDAFGRAVAPRQIVVRSFARRIDYPAHSFLRAALTEMAPDALTQIDAAAGEEAAA